MRRRERVDAVAPLSSSSSLAADPCTPAGWPRPSRAPRDRRRATSPGRRRRGAARRCAPSPSRNRPGPVRRRARRAAGPRAWCRGSPRGRRMSWWWTRWSTRPSWGLMNRGDALADVLAVDGVEHGQDLGRRVRGAVVDRPLERRLVDVEARGGRSWPASKAWGWCSPGTCG